MRPRHNRPFLVALGDALVDVVYSVSNRVRESAGLASGARRSITPQELIELSTQLTPYELNRTGGGSSANSSIAFAQSGGDARFVCGLGNDPSASLFRSQLLAEGVSVEGTLLEEAPTGTCLILVTPDGARSMLTCIDKALALKSKSLEHAGLFKDASWVLLEAYLLFSGTEGIRTIEQAISQAHAAGARVAFTLSDATLLTRYAEAATRILPQVDLIVGNDSEAAVLTGLSNPRQAALLLHQRGPICAVTAGAAGAFIAAGGETIDIKAIPCEAVDTTGAGDAFAGALLYGLDRWESPDTAGAFASAFAKEVVTRVGPRLPKDQISSIQELLK